MEAKQFIEQYQDYLAPKLSPFEQTIYLYIFRHSRLIGKDEIVIGFKSAAKRMGAGRRGNEGLSVDAIYENLRSLESKGYIKIVDNENYGFRICLKLPDEILELIPPPASQLPPLTLEEMDFFEIDENRDLILQREQHQCFYCLRTLTNENYVIEHIVSRPLGGNSYRNVAAACRECNNRKNDSTAEDYLRGLYRESFLSTVELQERLTKLRQLQSGELKPIITSQSL